MTGPINAAILIANVVIWCFLMIVMTLTGPTVLGVPGIIWAVIQGFVGLMICTRLWKARDL